jgi:hypothetical protein
MAISFLWRGYISDVPTARFILSSGKPGFSDATGFNRNFNRSQLWEVDESDK